MAALCACAAVAVSNAYAQQQPAAAKTASRISTGDVLSKLNRCATVSFSESRLEDVLTWIREAAGIKMEVLWLDDRHADGLTRDKPISVQVENESFLNLLARVLEAAQPESGGEATWQLTSSGTVQVGPRARLNAFKRVQIYAIDDLVRELPRYAEVPKIDLQQALQSSRGAGGGSPLTQGTEPAPSTEAVRRDNTTQLVGLIRDTIEPDQWTENGGSAGSIRVYQGALVVNAPDYIQRGIDGYLRSRAAESSAPK
jgi:hypothetical protein